MIKAHCYRARRRWLTAHQRFVFLFRRTDYWWTWLLILERLSLLSMWLIPTSRVWAELMDITLPLKWLRSVRASTVSSCWLEVKDSEALGDGRNTKWKKLNNWAMCKIVSTKYFNKRLSEQEVNLFCSAAMILGNLLLQKLALSYLS